MGCHFLSLFSFPNTYAETLEQLFAEQLPLRTPINLFSFDEATFRQRDGESARREAELPVGFTLRRIDGEILAQSGLEDLAEEIAFHWGSLDTFVDKAVGYCVLHDGCVVSWCYVQALGNKAQTIDIWTSSDHRGQALGTAVGSAVIHHCLAQGYTPFWFNDEANLASRRLAERLGFRYEGDLYLVDIPFEPYDFYRSLAIHFFFPQERYRQAAEAYQRAFSVQEGEAEDYYNAAVGWAEAQEDELALTHLDKAIARGWQDAESLDGTAAFERLWGTPRWEELKRRMETPQNRPSS
jgi:RimJ/RimL family protein N-acetyltransferase